MGSKSRFVYDIKRLMLPYIEKAKFYVEPFCGGCNVIDQIQRIPRMAADIDEDLICMWRAVSNGWMPPPVVTEEEYRVLKYSEPTPLKGYAAFALSYGGKKWGGWCRDKAGKRDYVNEAYRNAIAQFPSLRGVRFYNTAYDKIHIPSSSVVYCDPPYKGTTGYSSTFSTELFWRWVLQLSERCTVFVSEYEAPEFMTCVWEKRTTSSLTQDTGSKIAVERLFAVKSQWIELEF